MPGWSSSVNRHACTEITPQKQSHSGNLDIVNLPGNRHSHGWLYACMSTIKRSCHFGNTHVIIWDMMVTKVSWEVELAPVVIEPLEDGGMARREERCMRGCVGEQVSFSVACSKRKRTLEFVACLLWALFCTRCPIKAGSRQTRDRQTGGRMDSRDREAERRG